MRCSRLSIAMLVAAAVVPLVSAGPAAASPSSPTLTVTGRACPGRTITVAGSGFADGSYQLHTYAGSLSTTQVTAVGGVLSPAVTLTLPAAMPHTFQVTAAVAGQGTLTAAQVDMAQSVVDRGSRMNLWQEPVTADCFAPGERVTVQEEAAAPASTVALTASSVVADPSGTVHSTVYLRPATAPVQPWLLFAGQTSAQLASQQLFSVPGTTLSAGQTRYDNDDPDSELLSAVPGCAMLMVAGGIQITHELGSAGADWVYGGGHMIDNGLGSRISMQSDGNLAIYSPTGRLLWATGTAGSGSNNRLVLRNDCNMVMYTAAGVPVWSSAVNSTIGYPNHLRSFAYVASTRPTGVVYRNGQFYRYAEPVVYINAQVKQANTSANLVPSMHRTAYLQRYLNGGWQTILGQVTGANGRFTVGFVQPKVFQYRVVVLATSTSAGSHSASTFR